MYTLQQLSPADGREMYDLLQRIGENENGFINAVHGMDYAEFPAWLQRQDEVARGEGLEDWMVPSVTYWLMEDGEPIGIGRLRLRLTDALRHIGGSIGYAIDPLHRRRGCGKALLNLILEETRRRGMKELLITIYPDNIASRRVAEGCGGICRKVTEERAYYDFH